MISRRCVGLPLAVLGNLAVLLLTLAQRWGKNESIDEPSVHLSCMPPAPKGDVASARALVSILQSTLMNEPPLRSLAVLRSLGVDDAHMKTLVCTSLRSARQYKKDMIRAIFGLVGLEGDDVHYTCRRIQNPPKRRVRSPSTAKEDEDRAARNAEERLREEERRKQEEEERRLLRAAKLREKKKRQKKHRQGEDARQPAEEGEGEAASKAAEVAPVSEALRRCALTGRLMRHPVLLADGRAYERSVAEAWLQAGRRVSPITGRPLRHAVLVEDDLLIVATSSDE